MDTITFEGKVFTGEGNGKKYLALTWVQKQIEEKLGFTPFLGTLNIKLTKESFTHRKLLETAKAATICPADGYCNGHLFKAQINNIQCAIILPKVKGYPKKVIEIIAQTNLRETLRLKDGDTVKVTAQI